MEAALAARGSQSRPRAGVSSFKNTLCLARNSAGLTLGSRLGMGQLSFSSTNKLCKEVSSTQPLTRAS